MARASIILPVYNVADYLERSLGSALSQTLPPFEIIVVDDASTDGTAAIIDRFARKSPSVRPIRVERNGGVSAARNAALDVATGDWLVLLDGDDWMEPARIATLIAEAERFGADWIADDQFIICDGEDAPRARLMVEEPPGACLVEASHIVNRDMPGHRGYGLLKPVIRRAFVERHGLRYRAELRHHGDFLFFIDCAAHGAKLALLREPYYWYRLRAGSLTTANALFILETMTALSRRAREIARTHGRAELAHALAQRERAIERLRRYYAVVSPLKARDGGHFLRALAHDPAIAPYAAIKIFESAVHRLSGRDRIELAHLSHAIGRTAPETAPTASRSQPTPRKRAAS